MERIPYTEFEGGFNQVVLEESFVLNLKTTMSFVDFQMNFAVNTNYPLYVAPEPQNRTKDHDYEPDGYDEITGEEYEIPEGFMTDNADSEEGMPAVAPNAEEIEVRYPYRRGRIFFPNMEQVRWNSRIQPYIDPSSGSVDYGSIDYFYKGEDGRYYLAGYWGELEIASGPPLLEIDELKQQAMASGSQQARKPAQQ
jgi:hypothetical protein